MNAPAQPPLTVEQTLERVIRAAADFQRECGNDPLAFQVWLFVEWLKTQRTAETVARLDAERLERARAE